MIYAEVFRRRTAYKLRLPRWRDPDSVWPEDRPQVELGILALNAPVANDRAVQKTLMFNPLILTDGIEPSADPVLLARPGAYAVSVGQRLQ